MSQVNESRVTVKGAAQHQHNRHHHISFPSQEARIRQIFGLSDDAPLPSVHEHTLQQYSIHLAEKLSFPFEAIICQHGGAMRQLVHYVRVLELSNAKGARQSTVDGLCCRVENTKQILCLPLTELGVREDSPNCQLIDDYTYWFVNWR